MSTNNEKSYADKHDSKLKPDPQIEKELKQRAEKDGLACAVAVEIAEHLGTTPMAVGRTADLLNVPVVKCQLGLFGYKPEKKIVRAEDTSDQLLKDAITGALENNRLSCRNAWDIADEFKMAKLGVSNVCQAMGVKIGSCQLGAF